MSRKLQPIEPCAASENAARHGPSSPQDAQWCRRHPTLRCHSGQKATNAMLVQTETPFANAGVAIGDRKSVVEGKRGSVRVVHGGRRIIKKKKHNKLKKTK